MILLRRSSPGAERKARAEDGPPATTYNDVSVASLLDHHRHEDVERVDHTPNLRTERAPPKGVGRVRFGGDVSRLLGMMIGCGLPPKQVADATFAGITAKELFIIRTRSSSRQCALDSRRFSVRCRRGCDPERLARGKYQDARHVL
jgi:hypothetical protein